MARVALSVQSTARTGLEAAYTAATADGHAFDNTRENVFLHVKNGAGADTTVTISTPATVDGLAIPDRTVVVTASEDRFIGPFPKGLYNNDDSEGDTGLAEAVFVNVSPTTSVTYAAIKLGSL